MQVSVESISSLGRRMSIEIPSERIEKAVDERLKNMSKKAKLDGFRPGKVPFKKVEELYGASARDEVLHDLMQTGVYEAFVQEKINPAGRPHLHHDHDNHPKKGEPFTFTVEYEVYPEIKLPAFDGLKVEKLGASVNDADVEKTVQAIRKQHTQWETVTRAAQNGDQVIIDFAGTIDGEPLKGGDAKHFKLELGSKSMISGFEESLLGVTAEQDLTINATFPSDYHAADLSGKTAEFKIHVHEVKESRLPALDEAFAKLLNVEGGIDALYAEVRKNMERELQQVLKNKTKQQVLDALVKSSEIELPNSLVDEEIHHLQQQMHQRLGGKIDFKLIAEHSRGEFEEQARRRVSLGLLLGEIIKQYELKPEADKVRQTIESMSAAYEKPAEVMQYFYQDKNRLAEIESLILEEAAIDKILTSAQVIAKELSFDEVMEKK